jgi:diguanylate cyclase (GGDEF)-like protein
MGASESTAQGLSIRARLMLLALLAVVPLTLDRVRLLENSRADRIDMARADVIDLTRRAVDAQGEVLDSTRAVLQMLARVHSSMSKIGHDCSSFLTRFASDVPWITRLSVVGIDGRIACSSHPAAIGRDVSHQAFVLEARRNWDFVLSDYELDREDGTAALVAAYPALGKEISDYAIILASVDLKWMSRLTAVVEQRPGASAIVIDGSGTVIASAPEGNRLVGQNFASHSLVREALARSDGALTANGLDGVRRVTAFARLPGTDSRVLAALDEREILSRIDREIGNAYLQVGLFVLLILLAAWFGGEQLIVEPIHALARTATRIGRGDLAARPTQKKWAAEFAPLATALADMAAQLAAREHELRAANRHLEELASIDSLTGLPNRRSFDARLETEWQRACEHDRPIALMMIDVDHFKLFNDTHGHLEGDRCLQLIGEVLNATVTTKAEFAARYGGEEFALLLPDTSQRQALATAERVRGEVASMRMPHSGAPLGYITVSIGVACLVPGDGNVPQHLIEAADAGLYQAKRRGRNTVAVESPTLVPEAT